MVEVLIALSITALIMLGLVTALAAFGKSAARVESQLNQVDDVRLVSGFLRSVMGRSSSAYRVRDPETGESNLFFGSPDQVVWLGVMPARHGAGGLTLFRLSLLPRVDGDRDLVLQYLPYRGQGLDVAWDAVQARTLAAGVSRVSFAYRGNDDTEGWRREWLASEDVPALVQVRITAHARDWPPLVVRMRAVDMTDAGVRIVHGPTR
jgi:general secretion pathway protein J